MNRWQSNNCRPSLIAELANGNLNSYNFNKQKRQGCGCQDRNSSNYQLQLPTRRCPIFPQNTSLCSQPQTKTKPCPCPCPCPATACDRDGNVVVIPICFPSPQPQPPIIMPPTPTPCCCPCPCQSSKVQNFSSVLDQLIPGQMQSYDEQDDCGQTDPIQIDPCTMSCCTSHRVGIVPDQRKSRCRSPSPKIHYKVWPNLPLPTKVPGVNLNPISSDEDHDSEAEFEKNDTGYYYWNKRTKRFEPGEPPSSTSNVINKKQKKKSKVKENCRDEERRELHPQRPHNIKRQAYDNGCCSYSNEDESSQQCCDPTPTDYCSPPICLRQQSPIYCCCATESCARPKEIRSRSNDRIPMTLRSSTEVTHALNSQSSKYSSFAKDAQTQVNKSCSNCCNRSQQQHYQCVATQKSLSHTRCSSRSSFEDKSFTFFCEHKQRQVNVKTKPQPEN